MKNDEVYEQALLRHSIFLVHYCVFDINFFPRSQPHKKKSEQALGLFRFRHRFEVIKLYLF